MDNTSVIALGTFDGVHLGHRALIDRAKRIAASRGLRPMVYTFRGHPLALFNKMPRLLMKSPQRLEALRSLGCEVTAVEFTAGYAAMPPEEFARMLKAQYNVDVAVTGFNYTFGNKGSGDVAALARFGAQLGFEVCEIPPTYYAGGVVSSTRIRACLEAGDICSANAMLASEYTLGGTVVKNRRIGSAIGYPTANLGDTGELVLPLSGVYATRAAVAGVSYPAVTNIGRNPTVDGQETTVETHILDFDGDIYGAEMQVSFVERLRGDIRFGGTDELAVQIGRDVERARAILA